MMIKKSWSLSVPLLLLASFANAACTSTTPISNLHAADGVLDIELQKGKIIEITYFSVRQGKEKQLYDDYFPTALKLASEYGGRKLASFEVVGKVSGNISPQMISIFEWPSIADRERLDGDARFRQVAGLRDEALKSFRVGYFQVPETTQVAFRGEKTYEFFGAWLNPDGDAALKEYFKVSEPIKQSYGRPAPVFMASLGSVVAAPEGEHAYKPHMAGIVEWDRAADYSVLTSTTEFKSKAAPLMQQALRHIDMLHTKVVLR